MYDRGSLHTNMWFCFDFILVFFCWLGRSLGYSLMDLGETMLMYVYQLISIITGWVVWYKGHERGLELVWGGWWACWAWRFWRFCWFCWTGLGCVHLWRSSSAGGFPRLNIFETSLLSNEGDSKPQHCGEWTLSLLKIIKWSMIVPETNNMNLRQWLTQNKKQTKPPCLALGTTTH